MSWGTSVLSATLSASEESAAENLNFVAAWAIDLIEWLGLPGVAIAIALENLFPPLPSELILPVAGFAASQGTLGLFAVILWATLGSVVGALALYVIGVWLGRDRVHRLLVKVPLVSVEDVNRTEAWFNKYGKRTVFFGRMIPIFRSLISIPAGVTRMPLWYFIPLTAAGSLIWNTIFVVIL
jgi:membrane protein DedA with SNARE-associated domain